MRKEFLLLNFGYLIFLALVLPFYKHIIWSTALVGPFLLLGWYDFFQNTDTIRRNFPFLGRFRHWLLSIRPEIQQYFIESNSSGKPYSREEREVIYARSEKKLDTLPFGTQKDVYGVGYEWINHSFLPTEVDPHSLRIKIGGKDCSQPYSASILNISAMSYGSLSSRAIEALNGGAKDGNFAHNTGEGSISPYHQQQGGDLIWQIGTGYFGCRTEDGNFNPKSFQKRASLAPVKMIEIKISQGAKPGHGGILPAEKVTQEIAKIRDVPLGKNVLSPPGHRAFSNPTELCGFIKQLRDLSGGKPIGIKLCVGKRREFLAFCKAMLQVEIYPDYIAVDGGEGGTGAAPLEFSNHLGSPGVEGLIFVHNSLVGFGLRREIKIISSGKVSTSFGIIKRIALGADMVYSARSFMLALGCIQAIKCNTNECPAGIATQNPHLAAGLVVPQKRQRVHIYHSETIRNVAEMIGAMGLYHTNDLRPWHVMRRVNQWETRHYGEIYNYLREGDLLGEKPPEVYQRALRAATPVSFLHLEDYKRKELQKNQGPQL